MAPRTKFVKFVERIADKRFDNANDINYYPQDNRKRKRGWAIKYYMTNKERPAKTVREIYRHQSPLSLKNSSKMEHDLKRMWAADISQSENGNAWAL